MLNSTKQQNVFWGLYKKDDIDLLLNINDVESLINHLGSETISLNPHLWSEYIPIMSERSEWMWPIIDFMQSRGEPKKAFKNKEVQHYFDENKVFFLGVGKEDFIHYLHAGKEATTEEYRSLLHLSGSNNYSKSKEQTLAEKHLQFIEERIDELEKKECGIVIDPDPKSPMFNYSNYEEHLVNMLYILKTTDWDKYEPILFSI